jgi:dTDP-4-amino-4,6-dideoxygalactose transaminase
MSDAVVRRRLLEETIIDLILKHFASAEIGCGRYFAPIHMQPSYGAWRNSYFLPVTESVSARTLALPFFNKRAPVREKPTRQDASLSQNAWRPSPTRLLHEFP